MTDEGVGHSVDGCAWEASPLLQAHDQLAGDPVDTGAQGGRNTMSMRSALRLIAAGLAVVVTMLGLGATSAVAADHWYCSSVGAGAVCDSGVIHTYGYNNVAYDGPSLSWCEGLVRPSPQDWYSSKCVSSGNGYTIYGTWRDWCSGAPIYCSWVNNSSDGLLDLMQNQGANTHTFRAHSYW
jgi:hypothetical protein